MPDPPVNQDRLLALFRDLVLINAPALAERDCADYLLNHLKSLGLEVWEDDAGSRVGGNCGNVIAVLKGNSPGLPRVFLSAHMDTVEPTAGLVLVEEDGVIRTDQTTILGADDKAGVAPAIEAVRLLQESGAPHGDVVLIFSIAEEIGLIGAKEVDLESLNVDFGYVLDTGPPVGSFVTRTATHDKLNVTYHGLPAHAGKDPEKGIDAIQAAARAISRMKLGRIGPETTANFGIIQGGTAVNVVCPKVSLKGEARSTNVAELDAQVAHMKECLEEAAAHFGARLELDYARHYHAYQVAEDAPVLQFAMQASSRLGFSAFTRTTLGGSDANIFNARGVPAIVIGTGMEQIHTHQEWIRVEDLVQTARLTYGILVEIGASAG